MDFIRGIAILLVMNHHFNNDFATQLKIDAFGWSGVSLFFVLSGFLVGGLLIREWKVTSKLDGIRFLKRRILKIWPAYYALILFAVIFHTHPLHTFLLGNLLNIQNYTGSSLGHTWSLAVEEHFYLLLTLLILMAVQWKWSPKSMVILFISISVVVAISRSIMQANGIVCHEYTHCQIDALFLGVILALTYNYWPDVFAAIQARKVLLWATFLICLAWLLNGSRTHMEYLTLVFTDLGCGALLLILFCPVTVPNRSWLYRLIALIGTYSYGIYLWHLSAGFYAMRAAAHLPPSVAFWYLIIAPFLAAILFGVLMTKLIEFPFLILRDKLIPPLHGSHLLPEPKTPRAPDHAW